MNLPYFDDFLLYLKTQNYSQETIYNYERDLGVFDTFLSHSPLPFKKVNKRVYPKRLFGFRQVLAT